MKGPSKVASKQAREQCAEGAIELVGAHVRALGGTAYAKALAAHPKTRCWLADGRDRERMVDGPVSTEIAGLKVQRTSGGLSRRLSQVLFPVDALERAFSSQ